MFKKHIALTTTTLTNTSHKSINTQAYIHKLLDAFHPYTTAYIKDKIKLIQKTKQVKRKHFTYFERLKFMQ